MSIRYTFMCFRVKKRELSNRDYIKVIELDS
jgi:hypothetical protein